MNAARILGIAVLVVGVVMLGFAYNATEAPIDQLSSTLTGHYTNTTMFYIVAGVMSVVGGTLVIVFGARASSS